MSLLPRVLLTVIAVAAAFLLKIYLYPARGVVSEDGKRLLASLPIKVYELDGLKRVKAAEKDGKIILPVRISTHGRCSLGDLDAIRDEMYLARSNRLLFSLESIDGNKKRFPPVFHVLDRQSVAMGGSFKFEFEEPGEPIQLGLFLCKDDLRDEQCMGKAIEDIGIIINRVMYHATDQKALLERDKIYLFRYIFFESPQSLTSIHSFGMREAGYTNIKSYLQTTFGEKNPSDPETSTVDRARSMDDVLMSFNRPGNGELEITLPYLDDTKCPPGEWQRSK